MKRLRRIILASAAVLSLLLCLATVAMWMRSYWVTDGLQVPVPPPNLNLWSQRGRLIIYETYTPPKLNGWQHDTGGPLWELGFDGSNYCLGYYFHFAGFSAAGKTANRGDSFIGMPYWFLVALTGFLPLVQGARWRVARKKHLPGICFACGYDLRATPDCCPECGTIPAEAKA